MKNPLAGADLYDWMALRRVRGAGVTQAGDCWLDSGHRVPSYVANALTELLAGGLVALADQDLYGLRWSALTDAGTVRYERLCQLRQVAQQGARPRFGTTCQRAGVECPDPPDSTALTH